MSGDGGERPPPEEGRAWEKPQQMVVRDKARDDGWTLFPNDAAHESGEERRGRFAVVIHGSVVLRRVDE